MFQLAFQYGQQSLQNQKELTELNLVVDAARILMPSFSSPEEHSGEETKKNTEDAKEGKDGKDQRDIKHAVPFLRLVGPLIESEFNEIKSKFKDRLVDQDKAYQDASNIWKTAFGTAFVPFKLPDWSTLCFFPSMLDPERKANFEEMFSTKEEGLVLRYAVPAIPQDKNVYKLRVRCPVDDLLTVHFSAQDTVSRLLALSDPKLCFEYCGGPNIGTGEILKCNVVTKHKSRKRKKKDSSSASDSDHSDEENSKEEMDESD